MLSQNFKETVRQLSPPNFSLTLSCADLRWNDLILIICKLKGQNFSNKQINSMTYFERCQLLNSSSVLVARHFLYRAENLKRFRICLNEEEIINLPEDSIEIFKHNMIDRYCGSPSNSFAKGVYCVIDGLFSIFGQCRSLENFGFDQKILAINLQA